MPQMALPQNTYSVTMSPMLAIPWFRMMHVQPWCRTDVASWSNELLGVATGLIHEQVIASHMHTCTHAQSQRQTLPLWSTYARAACVLLNPVLKELSEPPQHLRAHWHSHTTHMGTHKSTNTNLHAWCNAQPFTQTDAFGHMKELCSALALIT